MDYNQIEQLRERLRIQRICQRAHIFGLAYRDIEAALKSNQFRRWGIMGICIHLTAHLHFT